MLQARRVGSGGGSLGAACFHNFDTLMISVPSARVAGNIRYGSSRARTSCARQSATRSLPTANLFSTTPSTHPTSPCPAPSTVLYCDILIPRLVARFEIPSTFLQINTPSCPRTKALRGCTDLTMVDRQSGRAAKVWQLCMLDVDRKRLHDYENVVGPIWP